MSASVLDEVIHKSFKDIAVASSGQLASGTELDVSVVDRWRAVRTLVCRPGALIESSAQAATVVAEALHGTVGWCLRAAMLRSSAPGSAAGDADRVGSLVAACLWMAENTTRTLYEPRAGAAASSAAAASHGGPRRRPPMPAAAALWLTSRLLRSLLLANKAALEWIRRVEAAAAGTGRCPLVAVTAAALAAAARGCRAASNARSALKRAVESGLVHMLFAVCAQQSSGAGAPPGLAERRSAAAASASTAALAAQWRDLQEQAWDVLRAVLLRSDSVEAWRSPGQHSSALWQLCAAAENGMACRSGRSGGDAGAAADGDSRDDAGASKAGKKRKRKSSAPASAGDKVLEIELVKHRPFVHAFLDACREAAGAAVPESVQRAFDSAVASAGKHGLSVDKKRGAAFSTEDVQLLRAAPPAAMRLLPRLAQEVLRACAAAGALVRGVSVGSSSYERANR